MTSTLSLQYTLALLLLLSRPDLFWFSIDYNKAPSSIHHTVFQSLNIKINLKSEPEIPIHLPVQLVCWLLLEGMFTQIRKKKKIKRRQKNNGGHDTFSLFFYSVYPTTYCINALIKSVTWSSRPLRKYRWRERRREGGGGGKGVTSPSSSLLNSPRVENPLPSFSLPGEILFSKSD